MAISYNLRPFQLQAFEIAISRFMEGKNTILAMPQGTGKAIVCILIIERILKERHGSVLLIVPNKALEYQYYHMLKEQQLDESRVAVVPSPNRSRLTELAVDNVDAVIFEPLENFPTKITEHIEAIFKCPKILFTPFMNPSHELIEFYKQGETDVDFKFSLQQAIEENVLEKIKETSSKDFERIYREFEQPDLTSDPSVIREILMNIKRYESSLTDLSSTIEYLLKSGIVKSELEQLDFRKQQLKIFHRLLNDPSYFTAVGDNERVWQEFFEKNTWIFGYGLTFIFNEPLKGKKLEQVVSGYSVKESGKRTDALMKSKGLISTLCFTEIKTHRKPLLKTTQYRGDSWPISDDLAGGIAQLQKTIHLSLNTITSKLDIKNPEGFLDEAIYLYRPKAYLIIGSLNEFTNEKGQINESKHSSFELFRRSLDIEIITFDELYHRSRAIVESEVR